MGIGEIIYSLLTLAFMVLIIFSPLIRKLIKSAEKHAKGPEDGQDSIYESVDSHRVVQRILEDQEQPPHIEFSEPEPVNPVRSDYSGKKRSAAETLDKLIPLKRAVMWKEILDKPVALRIFRDFEL